MVTDAQVQLLRDSLDAGRSIRTAAAMAGMSARTARRWRDGPLPSQARDLPRRRTRRDPFADVWDEMVLPVLLGQPDISASALMQWLARASPDAFGASQLRTLQRRIRQWRER